ncbi:E2 E3 hybrid ubiquitin- ligase UBE2O [Lecanosticta acicola]|uniref:E2 E3 hybrid ubiquitin- ligase UBE2O n=1 Tax=Lecanosticta acicola TaxID=111012 RepID=A0AAI8YPD9_9PEZI|nr:E2 E3 hybrid ubiquitin- ligase UBE2O [Lecanosticta acicola]
MHISLFPDDVVAKTADIKQIAVVERTHGDIDTHSPFPTRTEREPIRRDTSISHASFRKFLKDGIPPKDTVLVRWRDEESLELLPSSKLHLVDRSILIGDIVKKDAKDAMSGCVLNTFTKCTLQPMCDVTDKNSGRKLKGILPPGKWDPVEASYCIYPNDKPNALVDIPAEELTCADDMMEEDLVIFKDWIGRVEAFHTCICVKLSDNAVVEINEEYGEHADALLGSFSVGDIVKARKATLRTGRWIFGQYNANTPPVGTVVDVRIVAAEVSWIEKRIGSDLDEPPSTLERSELESDDFQVYDRTRRPQTASQGITISNSEIDARMDLRVRFRDLTGAYLKYSGTSNAIPKLDRKNHLGYDLNVFSILSFRTDITVQWQDLSITTVSSVDVIPDSSIDDEHAVWPSEIAHTLEMKPLNEHTLQPQNIGVIQKVNAAERMAEVKWSSKSFIHYIKDFEQEGPKRHVVARYIDTTSDSQEEISLYDIEAPASLNVRRGDIVMTKDLPANSLTQGPSGRTWLGEIVDTPLDGSLVVRFGAATQVVDMVLPRHDATVVVRSDNSGNGDGWDDEGVDDAFDHDFNTEYIGEGSEDDDDWDSEDMDDENAEIRYEDEDGNPMDEDEVENEDWESADEGETGDKDPDDDLEMVDAPEHQTRPTTSLATPNNAREANSTASDVSDSAEATDPPSAYLILEGDAPSDHRYCHEPSTNTPAHVKRTQKEHKILSDPKTLPEGVYIRSWESRLDLLRVLIVGPTETPYAHAPFVVDFYLPPTFPTEPPMVHFHSWPSHSAIGAIGRVNPNLYEDGKICLSVLGTWEGNKGESWNAAQSTLLQVVVSLLGLVLVREPYYNEAGYEALVGTEQSTRASALYSERIFLRAKGFLLTALADPAISGLQGLHDVVRWLYKSPHGPRLLDAVIKEVEEVLKMSDGSREPDGVNVLSKGACIPAKRLLARLQDLSA